VRRVARASRDLRRWPLLLRALDGLLQGQRRRSGRLGVRARWEREEQEREEERSSHRFLRMSRAGKGATDYS
jgi:hypothetical protein